MRKSTGVVIFLLCLLSACTSMQSSQAPTPLSNEVLPTVIALTYEAGVAMQAQQTPGPQSAASAGIQTPPMPLTNTQPLSTTLAPTASLSISLTITTIATPTPYVISAAPGLTVTLNLSETEVSAAVLISASLSSTETPIILPTSTPTAPVRTPRPPTRTPTPKPTPTITPTPEIPQGEIRIYKPGELSKLSSPIRVFAALTSKTGRRMTIDLLDQNGRLLVRQVKVFPVLPWKYAELALDLDFGISVTAEVGRLVLRMDDEQGRIMSLNSVNVILMAVGEPDLNPSSAIMEAISIQQPGIKALIQNGIVLVTGKACISPDKPLRVQLLNAQGLVVGERLASVSPHDPGGYGAFRVEVPYNVTTLTPVRLVVFESGDQISPILHLSSIEVLLSP